MKQQVSNLIEEAKSKLSGYTALYAYRLMNLCVKAEPASLLSVEVETERGTENLDNLSQVYRPDDFHFILIPNEEKELMKIGKGIMKVHPEFKQEVKAEQGKDKNGRDMELKYILISMPDMNDERHEVLTNGVKALTEEVKLKTDGIFDIYTAKIAKQLAGAPDDEIKEAKDALKEIHETLGNAAKEYEERKIKEIEEAYKLYLDKKAQEEAEQTEKEKETNHKAGMSMKMLVDDDE